MPAVSEVFLSELIGTRFVDGVVLVMSFSFAGLLSWRGLLVGKTAPQGQRIQGLTPGWSGSTRVTEISGRPMSRTFCSRPCSADWSTTMPWMVVVPSAQVVRVSPSNQEAQRVPRCPLRRISYRPASLAVDISLIGAPFADYPDESP